MAAEAIVEGARAVQEHPGDLSGTQTATRGAPRTAPTTTDGPDANPPGGKGVKPFNRQAAYDVLHRQITNVHGKRLLLRKMEQTRREGSWHGLASHGTRFAPSTGSAARSLPLPVQGPVRNGQRVEDFCAPPAQRWAPAARPARCIVGGCARWPRRWRSNRRGWLRWLPHLSLRPPWHASMHGMLMLLML